MRRFIILWLLLAGAASAWSQPCGLEDTLYISPNTIHSFNFEVFNIYNDDLAHPAQGICGIEIEFSHNYVEDMVLSITSPAGQSVTLTGPNSDDPVAFTNFTRWRVNFVPCTEAPAPDFGFLPRWDNNQPNNWGVFGLFTGSYHPYQGCLEDFNAGPVNGVWQINVVNNPSQQIGAILGFRLFFCDERGLDCCFAASGNLDGHPGLLACEGDTSLALELPPNYTGTPPDTNQYGYTYFIGADSIFLGHDSIVDLTAFPPGLYQICGLSYKRTDYNSFPLPDGLLTIDSLRRNLNGLEPLFCGEITDSCVWVRIVAPPDTTFLAGAICEGDLVMVGDSVLTTTGAYDITLTAYGGCDSVVHYDLLALPVERTTLVETICQGDSILVGTTAYTATGLYADTLQAATSCDSIVTLNLTVIPPVIVDTTVVLCQGETFMAGDSLLALSGNYSISLPSALGCDSIVNVSLQVLNVMASIASPDTLRCSNPSITLDGSGSMPAGGLAYTWLSPGNTPLGAGPSLTVGFSGAYILEVAQTVSGVSCFSRDTVVVVADTIPPVADAGLTDTLTCDVSQLPVGGPNTSAGPGFQYAWSTANGHFIGTTSGISATVDAPGLYRLIVKDTVTLCADTAFVTVVQDTVAPFADSGPDRLLTCDSASVTLDGTNSSTNGNFDYDWIAVGGVDPVGSGALMTAVTEPGLYLLVVTDTDNGCIDTSLVEVGIDTLPPLAVIAEPGILNCAQLSLALDATASDSGAGFSFLWNALEGGRFSSGDNTLSPVVDAAGRYELVVINDNTGCRDSASVVVRDSSVQVLAMIAPPDTVSCDSTQITLNGSASSAGPSIVYEWLTADGVIAGDPSGISIRVSVSGTYQLVVLDTLTFCSDTAEAFVPIDIIRPNASPAVNGELNCSVQEVILDGSASDTGPFYTYEWAGPCVISGRDSIIARADCPGTYFLTVENTINGCINIGIVIVRQDEAAPVAAAGGPYTLTCDSLQLTLDGGASSQGPAFTYQWAGPGLVSGANTLHPVVNQPGQYTLMVLDTFNTCLATATVTVGIDTVAPIAFAGEIDVLTCDSTVVEIGGVESSMGPGFSYLWTTANGSFAGPVNQPFALAGAPGLYQLRVRNTANGCEATSTTTVFENNSPPNVEAGPGQELNCAEPQVLLDGSSSDSGVTLHYQWSGPCLLLPPDTSRMLVDCPGVFYLSVTNSASGCVGVDSVVVSRDDLLPLALLPDTVRLSCQDGTAVIDASASEGELFQWFFNGQAVGFSTLAPVVDTAGLYTLVVTNAAQDCADTAGAVVILDCRPNAIIALPDTLTCAVTSVVIDATASAPGGPAAFQWTEPGPSCIVSGQGTPELEVRCGGLYTLIVTNTAVGFSDTAEVMVATNDTPPLADAGPSDTLTCDEPTAILNGGGSTLGPGIGYHWTKLDDDFFQGSGLTVEINDDGAYFLTVIDSLTGCTDEDIVIIERSADLPDIAFGSRVIPCLRDSFWLQAFVEPPGQPYAYSWVGDNIIGNADSSAVLVDTTGLLTLTVVNTSNSCATFRTIEVTEQTCIPCLEAPLADSLTCLVDTVAITASFCEPCIGCTIRWDTQNGLILSNNDSLLVLAGAPGVYTITATDTLGFSRVLSVEVRENTRLPDADAGPDRVLDCDSPEHLLGYGGPPNPRILYQWLDEDGNPLPADTLPTLLVSAPGAFSLQFTDRITGCSAIDEVIVTVDTLRPHADAGPPVTLNCASPALPLDGSASDFGPGITYSWSGPDGAVISGASSFNPTVRDTGWFVLTVTDTTTGCFATDSVLVDRAGELPPAPNLPDTALNCGAPVILLVGELPPGPGYAGRWCRLDSNGQPQGPCADSLFIDVALPGIYRFEVEDTGTGCVNFTDVEVVEDFVPPLADAGPDGILLCRLDSLRLQGSGAPATAPLAYAWNALGGSPIAGADTPDPIVFQPDTYLLTVTNLDNQCTASDTVLIGQDLNAPLADAGPDTSLSCSRVNVRLQGQGMTASGSIQALWTTPDGNIVLDGATFTPLADAPGAYILQVTDPQNGCVATDTALVAAGREPPLAVLDTSALQLDCRTDSIFLDAGASVSATGGGLSFDWRLAPLGSIATGRQAVLTGPGNYRLIVTDLQNGCRDTLPFTVTADYERPDAGVAMPALLTCVRTSVLLDGSSSSSGPGFSNIWIGPAGDTLAESGLLAPVSLPGPYLLFVTDETNGCFASAQRMVMADTISPLAGIRAPEALDCVVRSVELDGSASSAGEEIQYHWFTEEGELAGPVDSSLAMAAAPGWYTLLVTNLRNGCTALDSVQAVELATPVDSLLAQAFPPSCPGRRDGYIEIDTVLGGTGPFLFSIEGGSFSGLSRFEGLPPAVYRLSVQDANGCEGEATLEIPEAQSLSVELGADITIQLGRPDTLVAVVTPATYDTLWWWPYDSLSPPGSPVQAVNPEKTTTYFVWVSNGEGCTASDNIQVRVAREYRFFAPTAFSPNGDDNNGRYTLYAGEDAVNIRLFRIFDRWGNMVYENANFKPNDPAFGWDGALDGMPMDPAVFVFYAEVEFSDGTIEVAEGDLMLMR